MFGIYTEGRLVQRRRPSERSKVPPLHLPSSYCLKPKGKLLRQANNPLLFNALSVFLL